MELTIFAKNRTSKDGRQFYTYLSKLVNKKTNDTISVEVKFRQSCGAPKGENCPCNIVVEKVNCNLSQSTIVDDETGIIFHKNVLWISDWSKGSEYVDTSLDEYF